MDHSKHLQQRSGNRSQICASTPVPPIELSLACSLPLVPDFAYVSIWDCERVRHYFCNVLVLLRNTVCNTLCSGVCSEFETVLLHVKVAGWDFAIFIQCLNAVSTAFVSSPCFSSRSLTDSFVQHTLRLIAVIPSRQLTVEYISVAGGEIALTKTNREEYLNVYADLCGDKADCPPIKVYFELVAVEDKKVTTGSCSYR